MKAITPFVASLSLTSALISAAMLPCAAQDQSETNFRKVVSALSGKWSIRETSDRGGTTGEEVWQGGTEGMPLTEEFRATTANGKKLTDYAAVWRDGKTKNVRGIWCADFNDQGCTPFEVTSRDSDIEMRGSMTAKENPPRGRKFSTSHPRRRSFNPFRGRTG